MKLIIDLEDTLGISEIFKKDLFDYTESIVALSRLINSATYEYIAVISSNSELVDGIFNRSSVNVLRRNSELLQELFKDMKKNRENYILVSRDNSSNITTSSSGLKNHNLDFYFKRNPLILELPQLTLVKEDKKAA